MENPDPGDELLRKHSEKVKKWVSEAAVGKDPSDAQSLQQYKQDALNLQEGLEKKIAEMKERHEDASLFLVELEYLRNVMDVLGMPEAESLGNRIEELRREFGLTSKE